VPNLYRLAASGDGHPLASGGVPPRERGGEGDGLVDGRGGVGGGEGDVGLSVDVDSDDAARRCLIGAVTGERGIVGTCAGRAKARGDGDLAVGVGGVGGVVVADAVKVVVDSNGLRREGRSTATQGGVEGDGLVDDGSGVGRGEGKMGGVAAQRRCDVDSDDAARRCLIRAVTGERGIVGAYSGGGPLGCEGER